MTGVVRTFTIIHVAPAEFAPLPYAVVVVDTEDDRRLAARADGDLSWLRVGARSALEQDERFGLRCRLAEARSGAAASSRD